VITCRACIERLYPHDPRIPCGRYHHSTCDYFCNKSDYDRELEQKVEQVLKQPPVVTPLIPEYKYLDTLKADMMHLKNKLNEHIDASKKTKNKSKYD